MSASYVRKTARQWANEVSALFVQYPYYDTINLEQDPPEDIWWSLEFISDFMEGTFCRPGYIERGIIVVTVMAAPGTGDADAITAMEDIVPQMMAKIDPTQRLVIERYEPLEEASGGSAGKHYRVSVALEYQHSL